MRRKSMSHSVSPVALTLLCLVYVCTLRCALSGVVVDRGRFETRLSDMRLENPRSLKIYHGGSISELPLGGINTIIIDPSATVTVDHELYFSADITLRNGTRIRSLDKDQTASTKVFVSVQNRLVGESDDERFTIGLEDVSRLTVR